MNVAETYNTISKKFDSSRFSVWKSVREFLDTLPSDSSLLEAGCGNGKNLLYRKDLKVKGFDISRLMVKICQDKGLDVSEGDIIDLKTDNNSFDTIISVAVIHHLPTRESRVKAISELLRTVKSRGRVLITVWAYEQPPDSKRSFIAGDNIVPFEDTNRFYHIYTEGELESEIKEVKSNNFTFEIYWELGNWCAILLKN